MTAVVRVHGAPGQGLSGDRYSIAANRNAAGQDITLIELENIAEFRAATSLDLSNDAPRRNIVTVGIRLNDLCGKRFRIGTLVAEGTELCEPCRLFQKRTFPETLAYFVGKGGLRATIVEAGEVGVGDELTLEAQQRIRAVADG
jgi:MOSC domain-containing protein YiiM